MKDRKVRIILSDFEKLQNLYRQIDELKLHRVKSTSSEFITWKTKISRVLKKLYGSESDELEEFEQISFSIMLYTFEETEEDYVNACQEGLRQAKALLEAYLTDAEDEKPSEKDFKDEPKQCASTRKIFIVHGHNGELKESVARLVEKQGLEPVILSEMANQGKTIIEKFEENSDVGAAICLFSADDIGKSVKESEYRSRARQNVVFEAGFFVAKLGRKKVVIIADPVVEIPSDMQGVVYTNSSEWRFGVLKELKAMGYSIDYNKLDG